MSKLSHLTEDENVALENIDEAEQNGDNYEPDSKFMTRACEDLARRGLVRENSDCSYSLTDEGREMVP